MNEKIEIGEYVRTKDGYIAKFINYGTNKGINGKSALFDGAIRDISNLIYDEDNFLFDCEFDEYIVKHSKNIIDLIEEGDIIVYKSYSFDDILKEEVWKTKGNNIVYTIDGTEVNINSIKSIVTKEMFSSVEYRVENN